MTRTVHFVRSAVIATSRPSITATHRASRIRRSRSHLPVRVVPASIMGWLYAMRSTVPRWCGQPGTPLGGHFPLRSTGAVAMQEEPVDGRAGARDVCTERTESLELRRERRGCEVVRLQRGEVTWTPDVLEPLQKGCVAFVVALRTLSR